MMTDEDYVPTPEQIDAMLAYLPEFEQEGFVASELVQEPGHWPYHEYSGAAAAFQSTIYSSGFFCPFDWPSWQENAQRYVKEPESLAEGRPADDSQAVHAASAEGAVLRWAFLGDDRVWACGEGVAEVGGVEERVMGKIWAESGR